MQLHAQMVVLLQYETSRLRLVAPHIGPIGPCLSSRRTPASLEPASGPCMELTKAEGAWESYVAGVLVDGTWGDHITLQAMSDYLQVGIRVFSIYVDSEHRDYCLHQQVIVPWNNENPDKVLEVCFNLILQRGTLAGL